MKKLKNRLGVILGEVLIIEVIILALGYGAYQYDKGEFGHLGTEAVHNCPGTHVNDNCAHMKVSDL